MKKFMMIMLLLLALTLAGCENVASATGTQAQCGSATRGGECTLTIATLTGGAYSYEVENRSLRQANGPVPVNVTVTVQSGAVNVWVEDGNNRSQVQVAAGGTAEMSGTAAVQGTGDERYFRVYFEPQGEGDAKRAEGLRAVITYEIP